MGAKAKVKQVAKTPPAKESASAGAGFCSSFTLTDMLKERGHICTWEFGGSESGWSLGYFGWQKNPFNPAFSGYIWWISDLFFVFYFVLFYYYDREFNPIFEVSKVDIKLSLWVVPDPVFFERGVPDPGKTFWMV